MTVIGRKLVFDFGRTTFAIEMYPNKHNGVPVKRRYNIRNQKTAMLFNIVDVLDEYVERPLGEPEHYCYGSDFNGHHPNTSPESWMTPAEWKVACEARDATPIVSSVRKKATSPRRKSVRSGTPKSGRKSRPKR